MAIKIRELVERLSIDQLRPLVSKQMLELISLVDPRLVESNEIRGVLLRDDYGRSLLDEALGWKTIVDVLAQDDAKLLCSKLGLNGSQPYRALDEFDLKNASAERKQLVYEFFGIEIRRPIAVNETLKLALIKPEYQLFDHQRKPASEAYRALMANPSTCILHIPTGGGKTRTAMVIICRWMINNPGRSIVWLAASDELLDQAANEFEKAWKYLGDRPITLKRYWGDNRLGDSNFADTLVVAGLQKLSSTLNRNPFELTSLIQSVSLVVFDEAHQAIAPTYRVLVDSLRRNGELVPLLGLTATPGRSWDDDIEDERLASFFNYKKVSIEVEGHASAVDYLVQKGYLAKAKYIDIEFKADAKSAISQVGSDDFSESVLKQLGEDQKRNFELVKAAKALSLKHSRILLFAPSVYSSHLIANVLCTLGLDAAAIDGDTNEIIRNQHIMRFRNNAAHPMILCNYGVLTTGFDAPRTSCVIIGRPTKSVVLYSQMVGRGIRGSKVGGNVDADIVTVVDTSLRGFGSVVEGFNFWNNKWWG
jgi:DNA repair protein RadD